MVGYDIKDKMKVVAGLARGSKLATLEGLETRPTLTRVKEAMFSSIHFFVEGASVLDLFAGSGQMGIEAMSRGASFCVFVDENADAIEVIKTNLMNLKLPTATKVLDMSAEQFLLVNKNTYDVVFLDPPYEQGLVEKVLPLLEPKLAKRAVVFCETEQKAVLPQTVGKLEKTKTYKYGKTIVTKYIMG